MSAVAPDARGATIIDYANDRSKCYGHRMTEDEIEQLRHEAANAVQKLSAAETVALRALAAIEIKDDVEAKRLLRGLLTALEG